MKKSIIILFCILSIPFWNCASVEKNDKVTLNDIINTMKGEPVVPREANTIYISPFINLSGNRNINELLEIKIREAISRDRRLAVTEEKNGTDLLLNCVIMTYTVQMITFNSMGIPEKKRMRITLSVTLLKAGQNEPIFTRVPVQAFREYSDTVPPILSEGRVLVEVVSELADRIASQTISGWYTDRMTHVEKGKKK